MFLSIGLRIAIFRSVFGANLAQSVVVGVVQPSLMGIIIIGYPLSSTYTNHQLDFVPLIGVLFIGLSILWTELADRAGRPHVISTFTLLQAFLNAWTNSNAKEMEKFTESRSEHQTVRTLIARFKKAEVPVHIILPDIHPGPFNPVGGSNLPYVLFSTFSKKAIVLHSVSDHSLNLPSITELNSYIASLDKQDYVAGHQMCSIPCQVQISSFTVTGLKFGDSVLLLLSRAPQGMDDLSDGILKQLETYSQSLGFNNILVIDCHNALGLQLNQLNSESLLNAGKRCLESLNQSQEFPFRIGFANLCDIAYEVDSLKDDLGDSGLATLAIEVNSHYYVIGWADSNNMDNKLRGLLVSYMSERGIQLLEVCTSDTHATSGKRTSQGYFAFGSITKPKIAAEIFYLLARRSIESVTPSMFELASIKTKVRVMGKKQFDEYAVALNKSLFLTKIFVLTTVSVFIATLIL
jgi:putative membrane protein